MSNPTEVTPLVIPTPTGTLVATPITSEAAALESAGTGFSLEDLGIASTSKAVAASSDDDSGIVETDLNDESVRATDFDLYDGRKGITDRISIIDPNSIFAARVHFKKDAGYIVCQSKWARQGTQEVMVEEAPCCAKLDPPRKRFACLVVQYNTSSDGQLATPIGFTLKLWRFSEDKYILIRNVHREYPLTAHDLKITCSEVKYQKLAIQNTKECLWRLDKWPAAWKTQIDLFVKTNKPKIGKVLGRKKTPQELLEILGMATAPSMAGSEMPLTDLASLLPNT